MSETGLHVGIDEYFAGHDETMALVRTGLAPIIVACAGVLVEALQSGNKVLIMGNGGSAADAQHFAAELVGRFLRNRDPWPAIALTTDTSLLTAVANDFGFVEVFTRQVKALVRPGDVVIGISTSGNSPNVSQALIAARELGGKTIGLLGRDGGEIAALVDLALTVPVRSTPHIQEAHITIIHLLCALVEEQLTQQEV